MDKFQEEIQHVIHKSMPEESIFSSYEKNKVLKIINDRQGKKKVKAKQLFPKILSGAVAAGFLLFLGGIMGEKINFSNSNHVSGNFYQGMKIGEKLNGWKLDNIGDLERTWQSDGIVNAIFTGESIIEGSLVYREKADKNHLDLVFKPSSHSIKFLPIEKGEKPDIVFSLKEQEELKMIYSMKKGSTIENIKLKINEYISTYKEKAVIPDEVSLEEAIVPEKMVPPGLNEPVIFEAGRLTLSPKLLGIYQEFSMTRSDELLRKLPPLSIIKLFYYAEQLQDRRTQFALMNQNQQPISYDDFLAFIEKPKVKEKLTNFSRALEYSELEENYWGDPYGYTLRLKNQSFSLNKNHQGIWKINNDPFY